MAMNDTGPAAHGYPCCAPMRIMLGGDEYPVAYDPRFREYGILVFDGSNLASPGQSHVQMAYCPWCGRKLPPSLRDVWFDTLQRMGVEPDLLAENPAIPDEFRSDAWWKRRGL